MTDKQIIIDGVDVKKCKYFYRRTKECVNEDTIDAPCEEFSNCYYKQLKRKEQECEELKEKFQDMKKSRDVALKEYNEEFEYKRQITVEHLEQKKELLKQLDQLKAENKHLNDLLNQALKELEQSREVIEKIKEMCSSVENIENANTLYESKLSGIYLQARKILQICDEVNDER